MDDTYQEKERVVFQQESFPKSSKTGTKVHAFEMRVRRRRGMYQLSQEFSFLKELKLTSQ